MDELRRMVGLLQTMPGSPLCAEAYSMVKMKGKDVNGMPFGGSFWVISVLGGEIPSFVEVVRDASIHPVKASGLKVLKAELRGLDLLLVSRS